MVARHYDEAKGPGSHIQLDLVLSSRRTRCGLFGNLLRRGMAVLPGVSEYNIAILFSIQSDFAFALEGNKPDQYT